MDMKETSAMTEASGLTKDEAGVELASGTTPTFETEAGGSRRPARSSSQDVAMRLADRLRDMTLKAPLQAVFVAFLLGAWVARRL